MNFWPRKISGELTPLKRLAQFNPEVLPEDTDPEFEFDYIDIGSVTLEEGVRHKEPMRFEMAPSRARKPVRTGDTIVSTVRTYLKAIARIDETTHGAVASTGFAVLRPKAGVDGSFLYRLCQANPFVGDVEAHSTGVSYPAINPSSLAAIKVPLPDLNIQRAIAAFLDRKTIHIDQLIAKKERQLELLNDQTNSKIATAVEDAIHLTNVPLVALRRFTISMCDGPFGSSLKSEHYSDDGVRVVRLQNIGVGHFLDRDAVFIADTYYDGLGDHDVKPGDLLVAGLGDPKNPVGRACIAPDNLGRAMVKADCFRVRLNENALLHRFLACYFSSPRGVESIAREAKGVTRDRINLSILAGIRVPLLPLELQRKVATKAFVVERTARQASRAIDRSITLLKEHRAALIAATIGGQIDVRDKIVAVTAKPDRSKFRLIVGAEIIHRHQGNPKFGRVKLQKELYLAEAHVGIGELQGNYLREAAGPLDRALIDETEKAIEVEDFYRKHQPDGTGTLVTYTPLSNAGQHAADLQAFLGPRADALRNLINLLRDLDTEAVEAVTTLYAVWNDALIDGQQPDDATIIKGVLTEWHAEKGEKFRKSDLETWLAWMKRQNLTPRGQGSKTTTGRLFV
jgi:type I restriction enzyme S subunit